MWVNMPHVMQAEVSSANYEARKYGIRSGSFMTDAKRRCPELVVMPYEFEKYEAITEKVFSCFYKHTFGFNTNAKPLLCHSWYRGKPCLTRVCRLCMSRCTGSC